MILNTPFRSPPPTHTHRHTDMWSIVIVLFMCMYVQNLYAYGFFHDTAIRPEYIAPCFTMISE